MNEQERPKYRAVFISPHLDDAVFSCGGLIAQLVKEGPVLVLNLFTRYLSEVKIRGVVLSDQRYHEEAAAAQYLGFESRNLGELDVSFRRDAYRSLGNIFRPPVEQDLDWLPDLRSKVFSVLSEIDFYQIYIPLGIGWHVDHVLTHLLFESWVGRDDLFFYEDAPYCCIPHSTRYRLNEIATYPRESTDRTLAPINEVRAWWETSMAYADTALMKNLRPWLVRKFAVPAVSFYLFRLMALHRWRAVASSKIGLTPVLLPISGEFERKVDAMALYKSQFNEFFAGRDDCIATSRDYGHRIGAGSGLMERYWVPRRQSH